MGPCKACFRLCWSCSRHGPCSMCFNIVASVSSHIMVMTTFVGPVRVVEMLALAFISFIETRHITKNMVPTRLASSKLECSPNTPRDNLLIFSLRIDFSFRPVCVTTQNWIAVLIFLRLGCETGVFANITNCAGIGVALCLKNTCLNVQLHLVCGRITKSYCWTYCIKIKLTFSGVLCSIWLVIL